MYRVTLQPDATPVAGRHMRETMTSNNTMQGTLILTRLALQQVISLILEDPARSVRHPAAVQIATIRE